MQIASSTNNPYAVFSKPADARGTSSVASQDASAASSQGSGIQTVDFTDMTRQQLFDWMNSQIKSGKMSFEESSAFLGMTVTVSVDTGQTVGISDDTTTLNFMDIAQQGIEGAKSRNDTVMLDLLEKAMTTMRREQGAVTGLDMTA